MASDLEIKQTYYYAKGILLIWTKFQISENIGETGLY